jgi:predicted kinase
MTAPSRRALAESRLEADVSRILEASDTTTAPPAGQPALVLTIGLPGSGKSTFARRLAPEIDAVILESDALRGLLFEAPRHTPAENRRLFAALNAAARRLVASRRSVIIDATNLKESDRRPVYAIAADTGARLIQLSFSPPRDIIEQRLTRRADAPDREDNSTAGLSVYRRMAETVQPPSRANWNIDTSNVAEVEAALIGVVEACRQGAGRVIGGVR